jgi:predicted transcriptional regulator YdeE
MVLIKATEESEAGAMPSERLLAEMGRFNEELVTAGVMLAGEGLHPSSKGVRVKFSGGKRTVIDGPFAETKELIAGYWIWRCKSKEEAIDWVMRCPNPHNQDGEVEIRQIFEAEDFGAEFTPELRRQEAAIRARTLGLGSVRFEQGKDLLLAGLRERYTSKTRSDIPRQWERFAPMIGRVPGQVGRVSYGVCSSASSSAQFEYLSAVEVKESRNLPSELGTLRLPAREYAVFIHPDHVGSIASTIDKIWNDWVPQAGLKVAAAPWFERYSEEFDPKTGRGGMEIWIPLET